MPDWREDVKERFRVNYDPVAGVFRLLDMWQDSVVSLPLDATIPDDSPAMKILSAIEVNALLGKLKQMGWIDKMFGQDKSVTPISLRKEVKEIAIENITRIVELAADCGVSKSAILSISDIVNEVVNKFDTLLEDDSTINVEPKRGPGRPRKK